MYIQGQKQTYNVYIVVAILENYIYIDIFNSFEGLVWRPSLKDEKKQNRYIYLDHDRISFSSCDKDGIKTFMAAIFCLKFNIFG